ncbi:HEPN domain-containing protein [Candidatus Woesearchaeota archaeon]|nr:HEPN domain-containing protein [Candidatus Woesearchaeota archaeon]
MSEAKNKVRWCLNKAEKEKSQGGKHRGLIKTMPDKVLARQHLDKAEHNLTVFLANKKMGFYDWTISMAFYVMYHCCLAILAKQGYESRNQECTLALIGHFIEEKQLDEDFKRYLEAFQSNVKKEEEQILPMREKYQYTPVTEIDRQKVEELQTICQDILKDTKGILQD